VSAATRPPNSRWRACQAARHHAKAAAAILAALDTDDPPLRLPLGNDAADAISASLKEARAQLSAWEPVTRSTDFDR
jgi:hypothetical protein